MENRKKNGLIRLLGKIGRKVKILRVPLTVLVVVCVSIHHLFRQLFFDVKYHTVRMRALMGAVCVALLLTLFVIPAVADEMFLLTTEYEEITSEEEATPTPTPTPEIVEEVPSDDSMPTDVAEAPTTDEQTDDTAIADDEAQGEGTEAQGDGTTVKDDEGITYEVDENGNIIGGDDVKKLKKTGVAAKNVTDGELVLPTVNIKSDDDCIGESGEKTYGDEFKVGVTAATNNTEEGYVANFTYSWYIYTGDNINKAKSIDGATAAVYSISSSFYELTEVTTALKSATEKAVFKLYCKVTESGLNPVNSSDITVTINKKPLSNEDLGGFDFGEFQDNTVVKEITDGGVTIKQPTKKSDSSLVGDITFNYLFMDQSGSVVGPNDEGKYELDEWQYDVYIKLISADYYTIKDDKLYLNGKHLNVIYHKLTIDKDKLFSVTPSAPDGKNDWYNSNVVLKAATNYEMSQDNGNSYVSTITYESSSSAQDIPSELKFRYKEGNVYYPIKETFNQSEIKEKIGKDKLYVDSVKPAAGNVNFTYDDSYTKFANTIKFSIENGTDEHSGMLENGGIKWYVSKNGYETPNENKDWNVGNSGEAPVKDNAGNNIYGDTVYVYTRFEDNAGNVSYGKSEAATIDTQSPVFYSNDSKKIEITSTDDSRPKYYIAGSMTDENIDGRKKRIVVSDEVGLYSVKINDASEYTYDGAGNTKTDVSVELAPPESGGSPETYSIVATDFAGNKSTIVVDIYLADVEIDDSTIEFGEEDKVADHDKNDEMVTGSVYGYDESKLAIDLNEILDSKRKEEGNGAASKDLKLKIKTTPELNKGKENSDFLVDESTYKIQPKEELDVGTHKDVLKIEYDIVDADNNEVIDGNSVYIPLSFTVVKKDLTVTYLGNTEFFHARADYKFKDGYDTKPARESGARLALGASNEEIAVKVSGFVYDQEDTIGEAGEDVYRDPTMPGIDEGEQGKYKRHNISPDDEEPHWVKPNNDGFAKNYYFKEPEAGIMTCVRRQLPAAKMIVGTKGILNKDGKEKETDWYTSKVTIKPSSTTYTIMDYTSNVSDVSGGTVTYAEGKKDYAPGDEEADPGFKTDGYTFYNETTADGVTKYYYIHNEDTDEVSSLMWDVIKIDRTAAHETYKANDDDTKDGTIDTKADTKERGGLPYISVDADKWSEFLHAVTLGLYFNANRKVTVHNAYDPYVSGDNGSGISDVSYLIQDKSATDPAAEDAERTQDSIESVIGSAEGWTSVGAPSGGEVSFNVTETDIDEGYLYVRITNGAGLKTYLTIGRLIIFDSKGPTITADHEANYDGSLELSTEKEFADGSTFIAEKVHFTISDSNLHAGSAEDPAVRVYKGTDISNASNIVGIIGEDGSSTGEQAVFINEKAEGAEKAETEWDITLYCGNYMNPELKDGKATYTIVAKDDSGFVTIRYFTIVKPIYDISMASQVFTTEVYGYGSSTSKTLSSGNGWSRTSKANADANVTDLSLDTRGANYFNVEKTGSSSEWKITPKTNLYAGTYTAVATLTYDDTDGETKTTNGNILFRVDKRELTATYLGDTIRVGEVPTTDGKLSVTGFITGEGVADSSDGTVHKASGYVSPVIKIPSNLTTTTIVTPSGGSADNYRFNYVGGVLTVVSRKAEKGTHYTVTGTLSDTGWYVSNITLAPKSGYVMTSDALGKVTMNNILITQDTSDGTSKFYIKDSKTGEIYEQNIFTYKKDTVAPVISGVVDGRSYKANKKEITVTDDNLLRVAVNGTSQVVSGGKSTFNIVAEQKQTLFFIVAEDRAGHMTTSTVTLMQEDGADADDIIDEDDYDDSDDDMIQDDTNGSDDSDLGTFTKKVQLVDGAPSTTFTSTNKELKSNVLSSGERTVMKEGSDVNVRLRVQNIDGSVSQADKELVIAALGDYTVAKYLDITLWKTVGSGAEKQVTSTSDTISVTISIPSSIRSTTKSGKVRQFAIVRVHNGSATVLQDRDSSANTITINTSKFSVYALAYRDVDASRARVASSDSSGGGSSSGGSSSGGGSSGGSSGGSGVRAVETDGIVDGSPQTGDRAPIVPTAVGFGVALIGMITVIIIRRRMDYEWVYVDEDGNIIEEEDIR